MAHELAHQWWGVSVATGSWSDFWLNEGFAKYVSLLYLEHAKGRQPFEAAIEGLRSRLKELQANGKDRPVHFEEWKDAMEALGPLPYVKGALFLHRLRERMGDKLFWQALAHYIKRHAGKLVDSHDFQRALEEVTKQNFADMFNKEVYGR
jgi:aminopeptidase N